MATLTPVLGYTIAGDNDPADEVPIYNNFQISDAAPGVQSLTSVQIAALTASQKPIRLAVYNNTVDALQVWDGTNWHTAAMLDSPALTGTPTAPTPPNGDNSTRLATTAYVTANAGFAAGAYTNVAGYASGTNRTPSATNPVYVFFSGQSPSVGNMVVVGGVVIATSGGAGQVVNFGFICPANTAYSIAFQTANKLSESVL